MDAPRGIENLISENKRLKIKKRILDKAIIHRSKYPKKPHHVGITSLSTPHN